jgi:ferredoxin-NADP reductase/predicted pyridoxine 5'-phosphate oxidase superfamily flavin-nucleotide-binding protein
MQQPAYSKSFFTMTFVSNATSTSSSHSSDWAKVPFHQGEIKVQKKLGIHESTMNFAPRVIRSFMPDQHRDFYENQPFLVVAARDARGKMWSTLLFASAAAAANDKDSALFVTSSDPQHLELKSQPLPGDALEGAFESGSDMGILGIELATRRRNRVNGRVALNNGHEITFSVDQSFGNCPQYIKPRNWWTDTEHSMTVTTDTSAVVVRSRRLSPQQRRHIYSAETIFVATGYRGEGEDPRFGNDASHRGGTAGFLVPSKDGTKIFLPDYAGNNMYMSLGNLVEDPRMGITVPLYETGGMMQMTGTAKIHWEDEEEDPMSEVSLSHFQGALRWLEFDIEEIVELPAGSLPIRWDAGDQNTKLQVFDKIKESELVTSFYLAPIDGDSHIWTHLPGQHLTLSLPLGSNSGGSSDDATVSRSYSVSSFQPELEQKDPFYRISVRRDPFGAGSTYLHDQVQVGDLINVQKPAGSFTYDPEKAKQTETDRTVLFLSAGVGVTPILSMLHAFATTDAIKRRHDKAIWVQSVRNGRQHSFKEEVKVIQKHLNKESEDKCNASDRPTLQTFISYTQPNPQDDASSFDIVGRIDDHVLHDIVARAGVKDASQLDVFMCGPNEFVASMEDALVDLGVKNIAYETF